MGQAFCVRAKVYIPIAATMGIMEPPHVGTRDRDGSEHMDPLPVVTILT